MKRQLPILLVLVTGVFLAIQYFIPSEIAERAYEFLNDWTIVIGVIATPLGIWSLVLVSYQKIKRRSPGWQYSYITLGGLFAMIIFGLQFVGGGLESYMFVHFFNHIVIPIQSTMFSLLAFFIASAAYRAFRARSILSTVLLLAALILMIRLLPLGPLTTPIGQLSTWILLVPNLAAKRAIIIGVGLGIVATSIKIVLGIERGYMGRD